MTPVIPDTDVVSFLFKGDARAEQYLTHLEDKHWLISFQTEAELEQWALLANWGAKRVDWLRLYLTRFAIVPSSRDLVLKWAEAMVSGRRSGRPIATADAWIAATSLVLAHRC